MSVWLKLAAISGASGVGLGAYQAHGLKVKDPYYNEVFLRGTQYQIMHSLLLAVAPITRRPNLVGGLASFGIVFFSSGCYLAALKEDRSYGKLAPVGGISLILAWLALAL